MARSLVHFGGDSLAKEEFSSPKGSAKLPEMKNLKRAQSLVFNSGKEVFLSQFWPLRELLRYARSRSRGQVWTLEGLD